MKLSTTLLYIISLASGAAASCHGDCKIQCNGNNPGYCNAECVGRCMQARCPEYVSMLLNNPTPMTPERSTDVLTCSSDNQLQSETDIFLLDRCM